MPVENNRFILPQSVAAPGYAMNATFVTRLRKKIILYSISLPVLDMLNVAWRTPLMERSASAKR